MLDKLYDYNVMLIMDSGLNTRGIINFVKGYPLVHVV